METEIVQIEIDGLASDLADMELLKTFQGQIEEKDEDDEYVYTQEAQEEFNKLYRKYFEVIKGWEIK